ncbi:MAG: hypothetical protein M3P50_00995 [Actinomycetota bacterium]|nr:hypothetical protein [Actinomycetota bacterium]
MSSRRAALLLTFGAVLAGPAAPAGAATSAVVARGLGPTVTVDGAGTAFVAFKTPADQIGVCVLPAGQQRVRLQRRGRLPRLRSG